MGSRTWQGPGLTLQVNGLPTSQSDNSPDWSFQVKLAPFSCGRRLAPSAHSEQKASSLAQAWGLRQGAPLSCPGRISGRQYTTLAPQGCLPGQHMAGPQADWLLPKAVAGQQASTFQSQAPSLPLMEIKADTDQERGPVAWGWEAGTSLVCQCWSSSCLLGMTRGLWVGSSRAAG